MTDVEIARRLGESVEDLRAYAYKCGIDLVGQYFDLEEGRKYPIARIDERWARVQGLPEDIIDAFRREAVFRGVSAAGLMALCMRIVARDNLFDALLGARQRDVPSARNLLCESSETEA